MSRQISDLCEELQQKAAMFLAECNGNNLFIKEGAEVFLSHTYRTGEEQNELYERGRSTAGIQCLCGCKQNPIGTCPKHPFGLTVTKAKAGQSPHNCKDKDGKPASKAFDFAIRLRDRSLDWTGTSRLWAKAIVLGQALGLQSGIRFGDSPHFQLYGWDD